MDIDKANAEATAHAVERSMLEGFLAIRPDAHETIVRLVDARNGSTWAEAKS